MSNASTNRQSLSAKAARNLATATVTVPQMVEITPRWLHKLRTHTRVTDLYSNKIDQLREQVRLAVEAVKEREEWELINHPQFGLHHEVAPTQRITARKGTPTPDDLDELLSLVWKKPAFFLAHPKTLAAFGR